MDKRCDTAEKVASSNKYVLCKMPADWTTLPVHAGLQSPRSRNSIAVYTKKRSNKNLVYEGYICPTAPERVPMSMLHPPPREESFGQKHAKLREKIRAEEAEAEAQAKIFSEDQRNRVADSAASSKPGRGVVKEKPSTMPGREADESKQQIKEEAIATIESKNKPEHLNLSLQRTESNTGYPLPLEILDRRKRLLSIPPEGETEDFLYCFEPWENTVDIDCFYAESYSSVQQFSPATPADMYHAPEDSEFSPEMFLNLS
ncbi:uncharacterized protein LOC122887821 [Siniperca chuatsi]|uniref:uncharacterized protein LOC122887821 n=1 Tax=Siniperca chuatsi TaxID=119488 RepID=UPI001CE0B840|nr:uncharacterized protein LOC122887821 [Siniperca chuatsi]